MRLDGMRSDRGGGHRSSASRLAAAVALAAVLAVPARGAVLLELFTSQGCSSCPPADRLLTTMGKDADLARQVVPLAFHVDYWNSASWRDRFSDAAWTRRQGEYARLFEAANVYTPQLVIAGGTHCNGADLQCIRRAVEAASAKEQGRVELELAPGADGAVKATVRAQAPTGASAVDVMIALYESGLETEVKGGENARKTLRNDHVVRRLQRAFRLSGSGEQSEAVSLRLDRAWRRDKVGVVVFLQDAKSSRIYGAASAELP